MKRLILLKILLAAVSITIFGQTAQDALRYSTTQLIGTARYSGLGGAFGALGADFTTTSVNPAGIGFYKRSEVTVTPNITNTFVESHYNGVYSSDRKNSFSFGNFGYVYVSPLKSNTLNKGWRHIQFGFGLNRLQDFNKRLSMAGPNPDNSFLDTYVEYAEGPPQIPIESIESSSNYLFDLNLAWWTYLLDVYGDSINYNYTQPVANGGAYQLKNIDTKGSHNEFVMALAGNYSDRLYLGMTLAFPYLRYTESATYSEIDLADTIHDFQQFNRIDYLETKGTGINIKLGVIYRAAPWLRIGASIHTPTWYFSMKDYWWAMMESWFDNGDNYYKVSPNGNYSYKLNTPFRVVGSFGFIFGKQGLISMDYEFTDYSTVRIKSSGYDYGNENNNIRSSYQSTHTIRLGTEWRYKMLSLRGGVNYVTSPYKNDINDGSRKSFSLGGGYRHDLFFVDFAWVHSIMKLDYYYYITQMTQPNPVENTYKTNNYLLTFGVRF